MTAAKDISVLVVDDHASIRALTRASLAELGIDKVVEADNGETALAELGKRRFSVVVSDWHMDGMDGLALLAALRKHPLLRKTPFILLTSRNDTEAAREAIAAGVDNYVIKPFDVPTLKAKLEAVLGKID